MPCRGSSSSSPIAIDSAALRWSGTALANTATCAAPVPSAASPTASDARKRAALRAKRAGDHHLLDLVGALADGEDLRVAVEAAHRVLLDVAVAAVDLHGLLGRAHRQPARLELGLRGGEREVPPGVLQARGLVRQQPGRLDLRGHVGEL